MQKELVIQKELVRWIKREYPNITFASNNNEDARHQVDKGVDVGSPDLVFYKRENDILYILWLELKTIKGKLKPNQKKWSEKYFTTLQSQNTSYSVAYGLLDAKKIIEIWLNQS